MAVKHIKKIFKSNYSARKMYRELSLHAQLSEHPHNIFSVKMLDVIIPGITKKELVECDVDKVAESTNFGNRQLKESESLSNQQKPGSRQNS